MRINVLHPPLPGRFNAFALDDAQGTQRHSAVAAAYGWADYSEHMADEEVLKRLLALNLARAVVVKPA